MRTIALKQVADVAAAVWIPVIGMGGVESGSHARDLLAAGRRASSRSGTASFRDPAGRDADPRASSDALARGLSRSTGSDRPESRNFGGCRVPGVSTST